MIKKNVKYIIQLNENSKFNKLNFNDKMSLHIKIKAIIDWEDALYGFDDNPLGFLKIVIHRKRTCQKCLILQSS